MIQNLESAHGNNLRVRTLFEQDSELSVVYVVRANTDSADNVIWTEWRFDKINDENIRYTSNVEKQKPIRSGVRKSNGSRANILYFHAHQRGSKSQCRLLGKCFLRTFLKSKMVQ